MQHKLCLWLAALLLLGALGVGNPFLSGPASAGPADAASSSERALEPIVAPIAPPRVQPVALVARGTATARDAGLADPGRASGVDLLAEPGLAKRPFAPPAISLAASSLAVHAPSKHPGPACPDPELQALVVRVDSRDGKPVWVLRDGRQLWRNEKQGTGEPLLVPVAGADD